MQLFQHYIDLAAQNPSAFLAILISCTVLSSTFIGWFAVSSAPRGKAWALGQLIGVAIVGMLYNAFMVVPVFYGLRYFLGESLFAIIVASLLSAASIPAAVDSIKNRKNKQSNQILSTSDGETLNQIAVENTERLAVLRRKIEDEKDGEKRAALEAQENELQETIDTLNIRIRELQRNAMLDEDGAFILTSASQPLAMARDRLLATEERLKARSKDNLTKGIYFNFGGVVIILFAALYFVFFANSDEWHQRLLSYLPFLTAGIAVQVVGIFFLKTYMAIESELKTNKNEITNIELRLSAVIIAGDDARMRAKVLQKLLHEERNFILKRGETVAGEVWKTEIKDLQDTVAQLIAKLPNGVGK